MAQERCSKITCQHANKNICLPAVVSRLHISFFLLATTAAKPEGDFPRLVFPALERRCEKFQILSGLLAGAVGFNPLTGGHHLSLFVTVTVANPGLKSHMQLPNELVPNEMGYPSTKRNKGRNVIRSYIKALGMKISYIL